MDTFRIFPLSLVFKILWYVLDWSLLLILWAFLAFFFPVWKCMFGSDNFSFFFTYVHKLSIHMYAGMLTSMIGCFYFAF